MFLFLTAGEKVFHLLHRVRVHSRDVFGLEEFEGDLGRAELDARRLDEISFDVFGFGGAVLERGRLVAGSQHADAHLQIAFAAAGRIFGVAEQQPFVDDGVRGLRVDEADVAHEAPDLRVGTESLGIVDANVDQVFEQVVGDFVKVEEEGLVKGRRVGGFDDLRLLRLVADGHLNRRRNVAAGELTALDDFHADLKVDRLVPWRRKEKNREEEEGEEKKKKRERERERKRERKREIERKRESK